MFEHVHFEEECFLRVYSKTLLFLRSRYQAWCFSRPRGPIQFSNEIPETRAEVLISRFFFPRYLEDLFSKRYSSPLYYAKASFHLLWIAPVWSFSSIRMKALRESPLSAGPREWEFLRDRFHTNDSINFAYSSNAPLSASIAFTKIGSG